MKPVSSCENSDVLFTFLFFFYLIITLCYYLVGGDCWALFSAEYPSLMSLYYWINVCSALVFMHHLQHSPAKYKEMTLGLKPGLLFEFHCECVLQAM